MNPHYESENKFHFHDYKTKPFSAFTASVHSDERQRVSQRAERRYDRRPTTRLACAHPSLHNRPPTPHTSSDLPLLPRSRCPPALREIGSRRSYSRGPSVAARPTWRANSDTRLRGRPHSLNIAYTNGGL